VRRVTLALLLPLAAQGANCGATKAVVGGVEVIRLADASHRTEVSIAASIGNIAYEMKVNGKNILYVLFDSPGEFRDKPTLAGNPFLAPWTTLQARRREPWVSATRPHNRDCCVLPPLLPLGSRGRAGPQTTFRSESPDFETSGRNAGAPMREG
jgi:hypothetical protein